MTPRYKNDNRQQLMAETRMRLVESAIEEFALEGYEGANINHITLNAGVATGTIYNYFHSKNDLMLAILTEIGIAQITFIAEQIRLEAIFAKGWNCFLTHVLITSGHALFKQRSFSPCCREQICYLRNI